MTRFLIPSLRENDLSHEQFEILSTHVEDRRELIEASDYFELEPISINAQEYIEYALNFVERHEIGVLLANRYARNLADAEVRARFERLGCRLILAGSSSTMRLIENKADLFSRLSGCVSLCQYIVARSKQEFSGLCQELLAVHGTICTKPVRGKGGRGFMVISERAGGFGVESFTVAQAAEILQTEIPFVPQMMMPFLSGPERSIDCLAYRGKLLRAIVRVKYPNCDHELLEDNPELLQTVSRITMELDLDGLFNIQFLDAGSGERFFLEVNGRMAGGIYFSFHSGLNLVYWAVRLALGTAEPGDIPLPRLGVVVDRSTNRIVELS